MQRCGVDSLSDKTCGHFSTLPLFGLVRYLQQREIEPLADLGTCASGVNSLSPLHLHHRILNFLLSLYKPPVPPTPVVSKSFPYWYFSTIPPLISKTLRKRQLHQKCLDKLSDTYLPLQPATLLPLLSL